MEGEGRGLGRRLALLVAVAALGVLGASGVASAASFTVNDTTDAALATPGATSCVSSHGGSCTLRAAVQAADNGGGASTITVPAGTYTITIRPTGGNIGFRQAPEIARRAHRACAPAVRRLWVDRTLS